jgi:hypothetical protein
MDNTLETPTKEVDSSLKMHAEICKAFSKQNPLDNIPELNQPKQ